MINIDRLALADFFTPEELVNEIFRQCPDLRIPIPVKDIAKACGIIDIVELGLSENSRLEGMLVSDSVKEYGIIFHKKHTDISGRERFSIAHELGHHLLQHHSPNNYCIDNFTSYYQKEFEVEANAFSELLLMPESIVLPDLNSKDVSLNLFNEISSRLDVSFSAMANRCCKLLSLPMAIVHAKDNVCSYCWANWDALASWKLKYLKEQALPLESLIVNERALQNEITDKQVVSSNAWFEESEGYSLPERVLEQTYYQDNGYSVTLVLVCS
ncbi:ImmA/IrrE family metallo-endopeptidase [Vibrio mangrovi]|uniref:ImmA/IrrE family metallo-endopeptidase n=1 Tax=Vibrio mangrovi TaxID=474394 RepID=A0A1Y6IYM8_9VIBR|nr:ImmA/IrrE family metallo-endopeptidase [Vibrio mangrovi]MDW6002328.1 ImmA/IrrE family metallo-endopeptidase [Vibrio mangrovi]SMS02775.1 hypothetical protein VIM7927_04115 [Vibrio mangrovi]